MDDNNYNIKEEEKSSLLEKGVNAGQTIDNLKKASDAKKAADTLNTVKAAKGIGSTSKLAAFLSKLGPLLPIILYVVGGFILIVIAIILFQAIEAWVMGKGKSENDFVTNPDYTQLTLEEIAAKYSANDLCGNEDVFQKIQTFFDELTKPIDSVCEGLRAIDTTIDYYETKYASDNLKLSPGLLLSTIVYSYASGDIIDPDTGQKIDDSRPMKVLENIFRKENSGFITREKIKELVEYMIFNQEYDYYKWDIDDTINEYDEDGNLLNTTQYWKCKKTTEKYHYMSYEKYLINLRYGYDEANKIYFAGKSTVNIWTGELDPSKTGYEKEKNDVTSWTETPDWCKKEGVAYILPPNKGKIKNEVAKDYNKESLNYYEGFDESREDKLYNYLQVADYEDIEKADVFEPVFSKDNSGDLGTYQLNYKNGYIYDKFINFSENTYDEKITPKNIESSITRIIQHEELFNKILGIGISLPGEAGGESNQNVDTEWPYFPENSNYRVNTRTMMTCRCAYSRGDFHGAVDISVKAGTTVTSPLDGVVVSSHSKTCGAGMVDVKATIPGTNTIVIIQYTHLNPNNIIKSGTAVKANSTIIGYINGGYDSCSSGPHLDLKVYNAENSHYYNPSVFTKGIIDKSTNIPYTSYVRGYNNKAGASGYDSQCNYMCK